MEAELQRVRDELLSTSRTAATAERSAKRLQKFKADLLALLTVSDDEQAVLAEVARLRSVYSQSFSGEKDAGAAVANAFFQIDTAVSDWDELVDQAEAFAESCDRIDGRRAQAVQSLVATANQIACPSPQHRSEFVREMQRLAPTTVPNAILSAVDDMLRLEHDISSLHAKQTSLQRSLFAANTKHEHSTRSGYQAYDTARDLLARRLESLETENARLQRQLREMQAEQEQEQQQQQQQQQQEMLTAGYSARHQTSSMTPQEQQQQWRRRMRGVRDEHDSDATQIVV